MDWIGYRGSLWRGHSSLQALQLWNSDVRRGAVHFRHGPLHPSGTGVATVRVGRQTDRLRLRSRPHEHQSQPGSTLTPRGHHQHWGREWWWPGRVGSGLEHLTDRQHHHQSATKVHNTTLTHSHLSRRVGRRLHPTHAVLPAKNRENNVNEPHHKTWKHKNKRNERSKGILASYINCYTEGNCNTVNDGARGGGRRQQG